jgi:hypothetical protein
MNHTSRSHHRPFALLALACLLLAPPESVAAPPSQTQALRFAVEGRTKVSNLPLACGRNAETTIVTLCQLASTQSPRAGKSDLPVTRVRATSDLDPLVLKTIEIPESTRGSLRLRFESDDPMIRASVSQAATFLTRVVAKKWLPTSEIRVRALETSATRAYAASLGEITFIYLPRNTLDPDTAVHELAHHIEGDHRLILEVSKRFLARRAKGGKPESLSEIIGDSYGKNEIAYRANWATRGGSHYSGKFYGPSLKEATATELISMGLERLRREPSAFFREDSDYFLFLLLMLQGG